MKPAAFDYHRPASLDQALRLLAELGPSARLLAGGQSLVPMLNMRLAQPAHLIDLNDLTEWERIRQQGDTLELGFLARHQQLADSALVRRCCPLLAQMAATIAHDPIRQRGTLGGSLCNADPVAQLCLLAVTLEARMTLVRQGGRRSLPASEFFTAAMSTAAAPDELLLSLSVPVLAPQEAWAYRMFNRRHGDYALVATAVTLRLESGKVASLRLGLAGAAPVPQRLHGVEAAYLGAAATPAWVDAVAQAVAAALQPEEDAAIPAAYRRDLARTLTARALQRCLQRLEETQP